MDIYSIFTLIGGLAFFLYGISVMSQGLEKTAGGKLEQLLKKMTSNPIKSFALGAGITAIIQSSSAVTVMLIGLVNSGIMTLSQTVSVVIGANVGTTITSWMLSLTAIQETAGAFFKLLKPETFAPVLAFVGICLIMSSKNTKRKSLGSVFIGFAILMFGMEVMADAMSPLSQMPEFTHIMVAFQNPLLGLLVGLIVTMIIQSSSASIGILQALSLSGGVSWGVAVPIILGQNLGTCISAMLASIGVNTNAKRVAGIHVIYNILSVGICFPLFIILNMIFQFSFVQTDINPFGIAVFHTIYNIFTAVMLFPCAKLIEKLAIKYIPESKSDTDRKVLLDERLLLSPTLAISECFKKTVEMGELAQFNFMNAAKMLKTFRPRMADEINENEVIIDSYEYQLDSFLIKLSNRELTQEDGNKISQLVMAISEFERIGDHASNI
ncbi:Na/Pi cotransporter family protein, partial [bacterium]|nr:Na/Pi cotransporter family protein [bacterium]